VTFRRAVIIALALTATARTAGAQTWVDITPASGPEPSPRAWASAVHDTDRDQMVVFAGRGAAGYVGDIWAFDLTTHAWTDLTPAAGSAPTVRRTPGSVYDPAGQRMVTWSGQRPAGFLNDSWVFDLVSNAWTELAPAGGPPSIRYGVAATFDPVAGELVTFAGFTNMGRFDDVWRLDAAAPSWTDASPGSGPIERCLHSASYDSREHRMIMYGGQNAGALGDVWALDLATDTWSELTPASSPPGRFFATHVYDVQNHRSTVFGGNTGSATSDEVWVLDLWTDEWTQLSPGGSPPSAREGAAGVYDGAGDRMVVFGGHDDGSYNNEVWALAGLSDTPTSAASPIASRLTLEQNVPNPFNPTTVIRFDVPAGAPFRLTVYTVRGELVSVIAEGRGGGGAERAVWSAEGAASGLYVYRLETGGRSTSKKMLLLK
jgi:hypothetical protein